MTNGDDIHNLLKTLGHDAGLYQDLAKYNASRAALRRAAMVRPTDPAAAVPPAAPPPARPEPALAAPPLAAQPTLPLNDDPSPSSLSVILHRLASPNDRAQGQGSPDAAQAPAAPLDPSVRQPTRLDRLFGRLSTRTPGTLNR